MKLEIPPNVLHHALSFVLPSTSNNSLPIFKNALFSVSETHLVVIATDLEVESEVRIDLESNNITASCLGRITLPCKKIKDLLDVRPKKASMVIIENKNDDLNFTMKYKGAKSVYKISGLEAEGFPEQNLGKEKKQIFSIEKSQMLQTAISKVEGSMANKDVRYYLNGLLLECSDNKTMTLTATDGHRLSQNKIAIQSEKERLFKSIVPSKMIFMLSNFLKNQETLDVMITENLILTKIKKDNTELLIKGGLVQGRFPDYNMVMRSCSDFDVILNREELILVCSRARTLIANSKMPGLRMKFKDDMLKVETAQSSDDDYAEDWVPISGFDSKKELNIGVNSNYLIDALKKLSCETVTLGINDDEVSSIILTSGEEGVDSDCLTVLMPMRI